MTWEEKVKMVNAINDDRLLEAVNILKKNEDSIDEQAMSMFINGIPLDNVLLLLPVKDLIKEWCSNGLNGLRDNIRINIAKLKIDEYYSKQKES